MIPRLLILVLLLLSAAASPAHALESAVVASPRAQASLISESDSFTPGQPLRVALRLRMTKGWYTYWRNPGDAGAPPELDFTQPGGTPASPIAWPTPSRHLTGPVMSYGYEGEVVLPVTLTVPTLAQGDPLVIQVHASWLVCERICVPEDGDFTLTLPASTTPLPAAEAALFAAADAATPRPAPWPSTISPEGILSLRIPGLDATQVRDAWFAPLAWGQVEHSASQDLSVQGGHGAADGLTLALRTGPEFRHPAGLSGIVVITDHAGRISALELTADPGPTIIPAAALPLWQLVAFAIAAGLILNLMPCVFPVLAMKAIGLAALAGQSRRAALVQAGAYAAGVITTFLALAALLVGLRAAGSAVGWGFQFQSPVFVAATAWLLFAIGLNMSGLYEVGGTKVAGIGGGIATGAIRRGGATGSFFTGLLAVLVATPCTAPFMGAAIAGALAAPLAVTLAGFLAMGIGFALPYVAFAAIPAIARRLPRPGAWMIVLRQALAFPMYAAAVWLLWVTSLQTGPTGVLYTAGGLVLVAFALWATSLAQHRIGIWRRVAATTALAAGVAALALLSTLATTPIAATPIPNSGTAPAADNAAEPFTPARLAALRQDGRPVFVNMTAAWCVTCIVNEQVALAQPAIRAAFADQGITYLKGDWTRRDPAISDYLRALGRDGVPLYVLYPPRGAPPVILPQILTEQRLLDEIARAGLKTPI